VEAESLKRKRIECDIHLLVPRDEPDRSDWHQQCHLQLRVVRHDGHERDAGLGVHAHPCLEAVDTAGHRRGHDIALLAASLGDRSLGIGDSASQHRQIVRRLCFQLSQRLTFLPNIDSLRR
jgi:hypothetical protein